MTYYIYVPFKKRQVSSAVTEIINKLVKSNSEKNKEVVVTYSGEKGLENLPSNAKVFVLMHGQPGKASELAKRNNIKLDIIHAFESLNAHLRLTDGKDSKLVPVIANEMIEDGLFNNAKDRRVCIELYFTRPAAVAQAKSLAESFTEALNINKEDNNFSGRAIRIDYYANQLDSKNNGITTRTRQSIYSSEFCQPKLTIKQVREAIIEYKEYKSSRFCGLSGCLGLNRFFTSNESLNVIKVLRSNDCSDEKRFLLAKQFLARHSENAFAQYLKPLIENSIVNDDSYWSDQVAANVVSI